MRSAVDIWNELQNLEEQREVLERQQQRLRAAMLIASYTGQPIEDVEPKFAQCETYSDIVDVIATWQHPKGI